MTEEYIRAQGLGQVETIAISAPIRRRFHHRDNGHLRTSRFETRKGRIERFGKGRSSYHNDIRAKFPQIALELMLRERRSGRYSRLVTVQRQPISPPEAGRDIFINYSNLCPPTKLTKSSLHWLPHTLLPYLIGIVERLRTLKHPLLGKRPPWGERLNQGGWSGTQFNQDRELLWETFWGVISGRILN